MNENSKEKIKKKFIYITIISIFVFPIVCICCAFTFYESFSIYPSLIIPLFTICEICFIIGRRFQQLKSILTAHYVALNILALIPIGYLVYVIYKVVYVGIPS